MPHRVMSYAEWYQWLLDNSYWTTFDSAGRKVVRDANNNVVAYARNLGPYSWTMVSSTLVVTFA